MKNKKKNRPEPSVLGALIAAPRGLLFFLLSSVITAVPAALIAYLTADPGSFVFPTGLAALYISALIGGFGAYKSHGGLALMTGFFCGLACIAASLLLSLILPQSISPHLSGATLFGTRLPIAATSIVGAYLASVKKSKKRKKRR